MYERFEWQKLLSLFVAHPRTLERVTNVDNGMPGFLVHNFQYLGILAALLLAIGLVLGKNRLKLPVLFGIFLYFLFSAVDSTPFFSTALDAGYPMTRHFLFTQLHLVPLLALVAGMGMDKLITMRRPSQWRIFHFILLTTIIAGLAGTGFLAYSLQSYFHDDQGNAAQMDQAARHGYYYVLGFIGLTAFILLSSIRIPSAGIAICALMIVTLFDLVAFNKIAQAAIIDTGRSPISHIYHQGMTYDSTLEDLPVLNNYAQFAPLQPLAYERWAQPVQYFPTLYRYAIFGNKSYYDTTMNTSPTVRNMVSGYTLPRAFMVPHGIEDPSGHLTRSVLSSNRGESLVENVVFLNDHVDVGRHTLVRASDLPALERPLSCLLYTSPSPRDRGCARMPSSA